MIWQLLQSSTYQLQQRSTFVSSPRSLQDQKVQLRLLPKLLQLSQKLRLQHKSAPHSLPTQQLQVNHHHLPPQIKQGLLPRLPKTASGKDPVSLSSDTFNGAQTESYTWSQTITDIDIRAPIPPEVTAKDVSVVIAKDRIKVELNKPNKQVSLE